MLYWVAGKLFKSLCNLVYQKNYENGIGNDVLSDLPFIFLLCSITGWAVLTNSTVHNVFIYRNTCCWHKVNIHVHPPLLRGGGDIKTNLADNNVSISEHLPL